MFRLKSHSFAGVHLRGPPPWRAGVVPHRVILWSSLSRITDTRRRGGSDPESKGSTSFAPPQQVSRGDPSHVSRHSEPGFPPLNGALPPQGPESGRGPGCACSFCLQARRFGFSGGPCRSDVARVMVNPLPPSQAPRTGY